MTAEIIDFKAKSNPGNGAREALIDIGMIPMTAEWMLMELWVCNFKIVPIE